WRRGLLNLTLAEFNALPSAQAESMLMDCCGSARWAASVSSRRPYTAVEALHKAADSIWWKLERADWLEAFSHHPQIGDKPAGGSEPPPKWGGSAPHGARSARGSEPARKWAAGEQAGARSASDDVKARLARANRAYFEKFGYIYIVCAT